MLHKLPRGLRVKAGPWPSGRRYQWCGNHSWSDLHLGSRTVSNSSADERAIPTRCPWPARPPPSSSTPVLPCPLLPCALFLPTTKTQHRAPAPCSALLTRKQAVLPHGLHVESGTHMAFTRRVFVVWVFFLHKSAAASFETTNPEATQSKREQERIKKGKTRCLSVNRVSHAQGVCGSLVLALLQ